MDFTKIALKNLVPKHPIKPVAPTAHKLAMTAAAATPANAV